MCTSTPVRQASRHVDTAGQRSTANGGLPRPSRRLPHSPEHTWRGCRPAHARSRLASGEAARAARRIDGGREGRRYRRGRRAAPACSSTSAPRCARWRRACQSIPESSHVAGERTVRDAAAAQPRQRAARDARERCGGRCGTCSLRACGWGAGGVRTTSSSSGIMPKTFSRRPSPATRSTPRAPWCRTCRFPPASDRTQVSNRALDQGS
jgi:hypothetical protein